MKNRLLAILLAIAATLCLVFPLSACSPAPNSKTGNSVPGASAPSNPSTSNPNTSTPSASDPEDSYTDILKAVLTDPYYDDPWTDEPIPLNTLKKYVKNTSDLKTALINANQTTYVYTLDNDKTTVYSFSAVDCLDETFSLETSYKISEKEYNELNSLIRNGYRQCSYWIQELDNQRESISSSFTIYNETQYDELCLRFSVTFKTNVSIHLKNFEFYPGRYGRDYCTADLGIYGGGVRYGKIATDELWGRPKYENYKFTINDATSIRPTTPKEDFEEKHMKRFDLYDTTKDLKNESAQT